MTGSWDAAGDTRSPRVGISTLDPSSAPSSAALPSDWPTTNASSTTGLAVLSSDALSSVAYATEEILRTLILAGAGALWLVTPIGVVIAVLLLIVAFSYRQTIHAYPSGGGAYIVAKENICETAGLVAGARC